MSVQLWWRRRPATCGSWPSWRLSSCWWWWSAWWPSSSARGTGSSSKRGLSGPSKPARRWEHQTIPSSSIIIYWGVHPHLEVFHHHCFNLQVPDNHVDLLSVWHSGQKSDCVKFFLQVRKTGSHMCGPRSFVSLLPNRPWPLLIMHAAKTNRRRELGRDQCSGSEPQGCIGPFTLIAFTVTYFSLNKSQLFWMSMCVIES